MISIFKVTSYCNVLSTTVTSKFSKCKKAKNKSCKTNFKMKKEIRVILIVGCGVVQQAMAVMLAAEDANPPPAAVVVH